MWTSWNLWHGCTKLSPGCKHCYVYRGDAKRSIDSTQVSKTQRFDLPVQKKRNGEYKVAPGSHVATCFTSDFFLVEADDWRIEAWEMIRQRPDLHFFMITKRIDRLYVNLPEDWGAGYDNVTIGCTVENRERADYRLPLFKAAPVRHKTIICEPLLEAIDLSPYLDTSIEQVVVGGESGPDARPCHYEWVLALRDACRTVNVPFWFKQTGARFVKDGQLYRVPRRLQHAQARKAGIGRI